MRVDAPAPAITRRLTLPAFQAEGVARFGPDGGAWRFECPGCGTVSTARDFPARGADLVAVECIGRHVAGRGCRRVAYGPLPGPWMVELEDGSVVGSFPFADALSGAVRPEPEIGETGGPARAENPSAPPTAPARPLSVERGPARPRGLGPMPDAEGCIDLADWDYRLALGLNASVIGFRTLGSPMFYFAYDVNGSVGSVNLPGGFNEALARIRQRGLSIGIQDLAYAMELVIAAAAKDDAAERAELAEPELRPYWTAEAGWTDSIGCSCHISAPCPRHESMQDCDRCEGDVSVPDVDMAAHLAEVHGETKSEDADA